MGKTEIVAEPGTQTIDVTREFAAPPALLFRAYSEPGLLARWLTGGTYAMKIEEYDLRHGGNWRYIHTDQDGASFAFRGVFHGTPSIEGITQTFEFEGWPGRVSLERVTFEDLDGRTRVHIHTVYQTVADRDAMVESGMEDGMNAGFDQLDTVLAELVVTT